ncbi:MAG: glycosyltransferase family A protein [Pseudomonadota bacterium]
MADIAALVTVHGETVLAGPTFGSAEAAIAQAELAGLTVERRIGFDRPKPGVLDHFEQSAFDGWIKTVHDFGDQGATRNALAQLAGADFLAFLDADDLWSENFLSEGTLELKRLRDQGVKAIAHPEVNWFFEGHNNCLQLLSSDDPLMTPEYCVFANPYDAMGLAPREAHLDFPYGGRDTAAGYAVEDWQWSLETLAAGWKHVVIENTIVFKRRQAMSQSRIATQAAAVVRNYEPLRIDRLSQLIPTSSSG